MRLPPQRLSILALKGEGFRRIFANAPTPERLDALNEAGVANGLGGLDLLHLAVEGGPAHALGLADRITDATICSRRSWRSNA